MYKDKYEKIKNQLVPDESIVIELLNKIENEQKVKRKSHSIWMKGLLVASCIIIFTGIFVYNNQNNSTTPSTLANDIKGLPVNNYRLKEMPLNESADRIVFQSLLNFFEYEVDGFLIIKVVDTKYLESDNKQITQAQVLQSIYGSDFPETIQLSQRIYSGCTGDEATNLLRKDGVYLLPITKGDIGNYFIMGDLDVLFEIDDKGRIYSHSDFKDFNQYNGKNYTELTNVIKEMIQNDELMLVASDFGVVMCSFKLVEVMIISDSINKQDQYGSQLIAYQARVKQNLSNFEISPDIEICYYANQPLPIHQGESYLLFLDVFEGQYFVYANRSAIVKPDGTIASFKSDGNIFLGYDGFTVTQVKELTNKIIQYVKRNNIGDR